MTGEQFHSGKAQAAQPEPGSVAICAKCGIPSDYGRFCTRCGGQIVHIDLDRAAWHIDAMNGSNPVGLGTQSDGEVLLSVFMDNLNAGEDWSFEQALYFDILAYEAFGEIQAFDADGSLSYLVFQDFLNFLRGGSENIKAVNTLGLHIARICEWWVPGMENTFFKFALAVSNWADNGGRLVADPREYIVTPDGMIRKPFSAGYLSALDAFAAETGIAGVFQSEVGHRFVTNAIVMKYMSLNYSESIFMNSEGFKRQLEPEVLYRFKAWLLSSSANAENIQRFLKQISRPWNISGAEAVNDEIRMFTRSDYQQCQRLLEAWIRRNTGRL